MTRSQKVFLDSSFLIAFIDRANLNHLKSVALMEYLGREKYHTFTSSLVILQTYTRLEREIGSIVAMEFLQAVLESQMEVLYHGKAELLSSYRFLKNSSQKQLGLTETINADLMDKHGVSYVLTFDTWHNLMGTKISDLLNP